MSAAICQHTELRYLLVCCTTCPVLLPFTIIVRMKAAIVRCSAYKTHQTNVQLQHLTQLLQSCRYPSLACSYCCSYCCCYFQFSDMMMFIHTVKMATKSKRQLHLLKHTLSQKQSGVNDVLSHSSAARPQVCKFTLTNKEDTSAFSCPAKEDGTEGRVK